MIVAFPIAFYTSAVATLFAYVGTHEAFWFRVAMISIIAGIVTAAIAVIPGAIDLLSLPSTSRARAAGLKHAAFNSLATGLFAVTALLLYRAWTHRVMIDGEYVFDATLPLAISVVAWVSMAIAGSLGWTLVQTYHVGIKPALTHADRPSHEPEFDELEGPDTLVDVLGPMADPGPMTEPGPMTDLSTPAPREAPPYTMRH